MQARYYDGKSSLAHEVTVRAAAPGSLRVTGREVDFSVPLGRVRTSSRVGNTHRYLYFPDGSQCETDDNDAVDILFRAGRGAALGAWLHRWESRAGYAALAALITLGVLWGGVRYGIPALSEAVAFHLPASTEQWIGRGTLQVADQSLLHPTRLPPARQAEVKALFGRMQEGLVPAGNYRLELRSSALIGPNAFALPDGAVVVTDALVEMARNDDELVGVLAHELGHLQRRHALRMLLQGSALALVYIAVTGDVSSLMSASAMLPGLLIQSSYSREFEREADDFALDYLARRHVPPQALTAILERLEQNHGPAGIPDYLSTHPSTEERIQRAQGRR